MFKLFFCRWMKMVVLLINLRVWKFTISFSRIHSGNEEVINLLHINTNVFEETVLKKEKALKHEKNVFDMKISVYNKSDPQEIFNSLPKYLGEQSKLEKGFLRKENNGNKLEAGIIGIVKDIKTSFSEYVIIQESVKDEDGNFSHLFRIYFKIFRSTHENVQEGLEFLSKSIFACFEEMSQKDKIFIRLDQITCPEKSIILKPKEVKTQQDLNFQVCLPCMKSSLGFLFKYSGIKESMIVKMLIEADHHWLSMLFSADYNQHDQALLFGKQEIRTPILEHVAKGGNLMKVQQEDFISMLLRVDKYSNKDEEGRAGRVIAQIKEGLQSISQLTDLIKSAKGKCKMKKQTMYTKIATNFLLKFAKGVGFILADFGTDVHFTNSMRNLYIESLSFDFDKGDCQKDALTEACNSLFPTDEGTTNCFEKLQDMYFENETCYPQEVSRFNDPTDWLMMTWISGVHLVLPLIMCLLCSVNFFRSGAWWKMICTIKSFAKFRAFLLEKELFKAMAESEPEGQLIKDCKEKLDGHENCLTLSLLIESSCESSFQFFFQTLYR